MDILSLEILTPECKLFTGECIQVDVPGSEGRFGVLAFHMNFITSLQAGLIEIKKIDQSRLRIVVNGGLLEVKDNKCSILVEKGMDIDHVNLEVIGIRLARIHEDILNATGATKRMMEMDIIFLEQIISHFTLTT